MFFMGALPLFKSRKSTLFRVYKLNAYGAHPERHESVDFHAWPGISGIKILILHSVDGISSPWKIGVKYQQNWFWSHVFDARKS